jgi:hypothetical protein
LDGPTEEGKLLPVSTDGAKAVRRCLFCHSPFSDGWRFGGLPPAWRIAFDPGRGRIWVVCDSCYRWNLWPPEDQAGALSALDRVAADRGEILARTENITLLAVGEMILIRVGDATLHERAWWRYGREVLTREKAYRSTGARLSAYAYTALAAVAESVGLGDRNFRVRFEEGMTAEVLRWRRFGWAAWFGRLKCPSCGSFLRAARFDLSWWFCPMMDEKGKLALGVPCPRCDPWTPEKVYHLQGYEAESVLRRVLAYQNITGAGEKAVEEAVREMEAAGSPEDFMKSSLRDGPFLRELSFPQAVALEISLNEGVERRALEVEARGLEFMWRREEELARIMDEELDPRGLRSKWRARAEGGPPPAL